MNSVSLWTAVRAAQIQRVLDYEPLPDGPIHALVAFYSHSLYTLAIIGARLQGFRYDLTKRKLFGTFDPVLRLSEVRRISRETLFRRFSPPSSC